MSSIAARLHLVVAALIVAASSADPARAQAQARPQIYAVRNVRLAAPEDSPKFTLILRRGRIDSVLDAAAEPPPEARVVEGQGLLALPAFIDAFTHAGCATPTPAADRDAPPKASAEALVDMREANRKGIQPAFRAADAFKLEADVAKRYRESGFGALLSAPAGQFLAGRSAVACTRDVPSRGALVAPIAFLHAGFRASGSGYPGTLMGAIAQLRQFLLDAQRHRELSARRAAGKPGLRPPYDPDLEAVLPALERRTRVVCEADGVGDIERWIDLADEFGFEIAISGGREAWKRAPLLKTRGIPVLLTLDWGEEVEDPHAKEKEKGKKKAGGKKAEDQVAPEGEAKPGAVQPEVIPGPAPAPGPGTDPKVQEPSKPAPEADPRPQEPTKPATEIDPKPQEPSKPALETDPKLEEPTKPPTEKVDPVSGDEAKKDTTEADAWKYQEPLRVREEKRREWEETRDCAIRLSEAGVSFAFGTGKGAPKDLLERVRTLVEKGLPADVALRAVTSEAAAILGVGHEYGRIEPGIAASFALWTKSPLVAKDAKVAWLFVDGFPYEFEVKTEDLKGKPDEGVDATGTWTFEFENPQARPATAELKMTKEGEVQGTIRYRNPSDDGERSGEFEGRVAGKKLKLSGSVKTGNFEAEVEIEAEIEADEMKGTTTWKFSGRDDTRKFKGVRKPKGEEASR